ncbi:E3 ubiquitin-protein ligase makorin [Zea mays]|uniref:E3 ubiquitin-protein ligase makorin n=1 Tax=Zea mays TaxID=4577 RepID=A0A1D6NZP4_MAIZE|nr:E3 ubiquitin-protein ligase makorin [Zea mays]
MARLGFPGCVPTCSTTAGRHPACRRLPGEPFRCPGLRLPGRIGRSDPTTGGGPRCRHTWGSAAGGQQRRGELWPCPRFGTTRFLMWDPGGCWSGCWISPSCPSAGTGRC